MTSVGKKRNAYGVLWGNLKERDRCEDRRREEGNIKMDL
jgi:hypothetical protein